MLRYDDDTPNEYESVHINAESVRVGAILDFTNLRDTAEFYYYINGKRKRLGIQHKLYFWLDHFVGCRFALFAYSSNGEPLYAPDVVEKDGKAGVVFQLCSRKQGRGYMCI